MIGPDRHPSRTVIATLAVLFIGLALTGTGYRYAVRGAEERATQRFDDAFDRSRADIEAELQTDLDMLRDIGAFVVAGGEPATPAGVHEYVAAAGVFERFPSLLGVVVIRRVAPADLDSFVADQRRTQPDFSVVSLGPTPPGVPHYIVTAYEAGAIDFILPPGLDLSALGSVRDELEARGREGEAGAGAIQNDPIVQKLSGADPRLRQFDFLMGVPIWATGSSHQAGDMPSVWVSAPIGRFDDILARSLRGQSAEIGLRLAIEIQSTSLSDPARRVAERKESPGPIEQAAYARDATFTTGGIDWSLTGWSAPPAVLAGNDDGNAKLVVAIGLVATAFAVFGVDLRERSRLRERRLRLLEASSELVAVQRDVLASVREAVVVLDPNGRILTSNPGWERLRGRDPAMAADGAAPDDHKSYLDVMRHVADAHLGELETAIERVRSGQEGRAEVEIVLQAGAKAWWAAIRVTPLHAQPGGVVIVHRDVTAQRRSMQELRQQATHDSLTGLLNRSALEDEARSRIAAVRDAGDLIAALFIDLDDFKLVNDNYGHGAGDRVLSVVAERIRRATRAADLVARLGGDEFVVVLAPLGNPQAAEELAHRLILSIGRPIRCDGTTVTVGASIGVVVLDASKDASLAGLLTLADKAMHDAKQHGGTTYTMAR